jgi:dihydroxy-acid dehydratase
MDKFYLIYFCDRTRFSGGSHGFIIGHIAPEAQEGGPIALVNDNDFISIDIEKNQIHLEVSDEELTKRKTNWKMPKYKAMKGTLFKYIKNVSSASLGCVTDN